jgi:hypothetical protein
MCVRCFDNNVYGKECLKKNGDRMKGFSYIKLTVRQKGSAENLNFPKIPIWGKYRKIEAKLSI